MSETEHINFSRILAYQTAPSMLGIKPASLINVDENKFSVDENVSYFNSRASVKRLKIRELRELGGRKLLLLYNERLLEEHLKNPQIRSFLYSYDYAFTLSLDECLDKLSQRLNYSEGFPHEIGIFLGYPIEDVEGFINNKGENYLMCGCWKVYHDESRAKKQFTNYDKCRSFLCKKLDAGVDIYKALKIS